MMIKGSCRCGQVRYQLDGEIALINNCHCSMCRKAHGAAFGSFLHADAGGFRWLAGEALVTSYRSSPTNVRAFRSVCGSNMPMVETADDEVNIPAGTFDDDPGVKPIVHIFTGSMAPWHEITDDIDRFAEFSRRRYRAPRRSIPAAGTRPGSDPMSKDVEIIAADPARRRVFLSIVIVAFITLVIATATMGNPAKRFFERVFEDVTALAETDPERAGQFHEARLIAGR